MRRKSHLHHLGANPAPCLPLLLFLTLFTGVLDVTEPYFAVSYREPAGESLTLTRNSYTRRHPHGWHCKSCPVQGRPGDLMVRDFGERAQARGWWDLFLLLSSSFWATGDSRHEDALLWASTMGLLFALLCLSLFGSQVHWE